MSVNKPPYRPRVRAVLLAASTFVLAACGGRDAKVFEPSAWFGEEGTPGTVTDLTVEAVGGTSVTLAFTEVDDGTGQPASYFVRYVESPMGSWGHASDVSQGSCQVPMAGTEIGAWRSCTVEGLAPSTTYDFQLVAFRGTLNQDAVFGELSNIVTATTEVGGSSETGDIEVTVRTTGSDPDPDGYLVVIDWSREKGIGINQTIRIRDVAVGDHTVKLDGVAEHCTVSGGSKRTVTVTAGGVTPVAFDVTCGDVTPGTGDLVVTATTSGSAPDPDGYTVTISGAGGTASQAVATDGSVTFAGIPSGTYDVTLSGLAANCTVSDNPRSVTVPAGGTGSTTFSVTCGGEPPPTGGRVTALGTIGTGPATPGGARQEFDLDVAATLSGRVFFRDWGVVRVDGSIGTLIVSPTDGATSITAFRASSAICADPTRGVEFDGVGRVNTGGDSNPAGDELLEFAVAACDNGPAGSGMDIITVSLPDHGYRAGPDVLSSGDVVKSGS